MAKRGPSAPWQTPENLALLESMWREGATCVTIGRALGTTSDTIMAKVKRMMLPGHTKSARDPNEPMLQCPRPKRVRNRSSWMTDDKVAILRAMWADHESVHAIAEALGAPPRSIGMKAHLLGLPKRPRIVTRRAVKSPRIEPRAETTPPTKAPVFYGESMACAYPHGDPGYPGFHFCGKSSLPSKPYCVEHLRICYTFRSSKFRYVEWTRNLNNPN